MSRIKVLWLYVAITLTAGTSHAGNLRVLMVSPEQTGIFQTGGLAHATTGLVEALNKEGYQAEVLMPYFLEMNAPEVHDTGQVIAAPTDFREGRFHKRNFFSLLKYNSPGNPTLFLRHQSGEGPNLFDNRSHGSGKKFYAPEYHIGESFGTFAKAAANYILSQNYDLVILNDWTTALIATYLADARKQGRKVPKVIFAIHNLAYQGLFPKSLADFMGLPDSHFEMHDGYEFHGHMSFLKAGLQHSDMIYTVSPQYAQEIQTERFGAGLDGVIRKKAAQGRVTGILNGISNHEWDPHVERHGLEFTFTSSDFSGKKEGKIDLQLRLNLPLAPDTPLFIMTSRMAEQKGFEYLIDAVSDAVQRLDAQWVVMGDGEAKYINRFKDLERRHPDKIRYRAFSPDLERRLTRYGDGFLNAAWFEPSGLNQFFAMRNGTLPIVSAVGGHVNSVQNGETGFLFPIVHGTDGENYDREATRRAVFEAITRAVVVYKDSHRLQQMRTNAMKQDHSWQRRVRDQFRGLFGTVLEDRRAVPRPASCDQDLTPKK